MMSFRSSRAFKLFAAASCIALWSFSAYAVTGGDSLEDESASTDSGGAAFSTQQVVRGIEAAQQKMSTYYEALFGRIFNTLQEIGERKSNTQVVLGSENSEEHNQSFLNFSQLMAVANERALSSILTDQVRLSLDEINYKVLEGYQKVPGVGYFNASNPTVDGPLSNIAQIYQLHVNLFCNPVGLKHPPDGCGKMRAAARIEGNENFVDLFLSERTWPSEAVTDAMQVARSYFLDMKQHFSAEVSTNNPSAMISWQRAAALDTVRMSILDALAARRAPTSTATDKVLGALLTSLAATGDVSTIDYKNLCTRNKLNMIEAYVCNLTNLPAKDPNDPNAPVSTDRIISQAAIDRVMQYDYYMSPLFYNSINSPAINPRGSMERIEVLQLAQQLTQDYYFLRLLQMKTVAQSLKMASDFRTR